MTKRKSNDAVQQPAQDTETLRKRALKALREGDFDFALKAVQRGEANIQDMVEDLKVYQAELQIQNDELRESQLQTEFAMRRFSQFFTSLPLPVLVIDSLGVIRECNDEAERRFNLGQQHLRSHFLPSLIQNQDHARLLQFLQSTQQTGQGQIVDVVFRSTDQTVFIGDLYGTLLGGANSHTNEVLISIIDQSQNVAQRSALDASRRHFEAYFDSSPVGMASISPDKGWIEVNDKLCEMLGYLSLALSRMTWLEITHQDDAEPELILFHRLLNNDIDGYQIDKRFVRQDGTILHAFVAVTAVRKSGNSLDYCVAIVEDIGRRKLAELALLERDLLLQQRSLDLNKRLKELSTIYAVSRLAHSVKEQSVFLAELLTLIPHGLLHPQDTQIRIEIQGDLYETPGASCMLAALHSQIVLENDSSGEIVVGYDKRHDVLDHGPFYIEEQKFVDGLAELIVWVCNRSYAEHDREQSQQRIESLAHHDPLTGLPNRILLRDRFEQARARNQRLDRLVAMLFMDMDHFKNINDTLGHPAGDQLLMEAARRLSVCMREMDTVSRIGGDEFVVLLSDVNSLEDIKNVSQKLLDTLSQPFEIEQTSFNLSCSIGISICPDDAQDFDTLLKKADTALYQAKACGRNNHQFFTDEMNQQIARLMQLEVEMRQGLGLRQFFLCYQPQINLDTLAVQGVEALLRWHHPRMGPIAPGEFIAVAEESGFIVDLGHIVLREACLQAKHWLDQGLSIVTAVNVSYAQFTRNNLVGLVKASLADSGLPPYYLELELTESILAADPVKVLSVMRELKAMGVRFSIDDFGTGYSSLKYLKCFPVDKLKIDQSFVCDVPGAHDDEAIVCAVINLARSLNISCIAEGVETEQQASFLKAKGCQEAQGYFFARPLTVDQLATFLGFRQK